MSLQIQVLAQDKARWTEGTLLVVERDKQFFGSDSHLSDVDELKALMEQFKSNPKAE